MTPRPVLLVTRDESLLDDLLRLAAAAGVELDVAHDPVSALRGWSAAAAVLVGADEAAAMAGHRPPRRDRVHVLCRGPAPERLFEAALVTGARDVLELPQAEEWVAELLADASDGGASTARTVGVVAGSGGAGATTFACAVAATAARSGPAMLLDLDPLGPGVDRVVGLDDADGIRWDALLAASGRLGGRALRAALPRRDALAVLGWGPGAGGPLQVDSVREVLAAAQRGHEVVVVDLPRALDRVATEVATRSDMVVVVAVATVPGAAAAAKVAARLRPLNDRVALVVRRVSAAVPAEQVAGAVELPLLCEMPGQRRLAEDLDLGLGPVRSRRSPLARAAGVALRAVAGTAVAA